MKWEDDARSAAAIYGSALDVGFGAPITQAVFIDSRTPDIAGLKPGEAAFLINPDSDGLAQIAAILAANNLTGLSAIDLVGHGAAGAVTLGSTTLDEASLAANATYLTAIGAALAPDGDLALYACDTAAGAAGRAFIDDLSRYVGGADVLAATHLVGSADEGGSFTLDASTRDAPTAPAPFTAQATADYQGELASSPAAQLWFVTGSPGEPQTYTTIQHEDNAVGALGSGRNETDVYQGSGLEIDSQTIALATAAGKYFIGESDGHGDDKILEEPIGSAPSFGGSSTIFSAAEPNAAAIVNLVVDAPDNIVYFAVNNTFDELTFSGANFTGSVTSTVLSTFPNGVLAASDVTVDAAHHTAYFTEVGASFSFTHTQVTSNKIYAIANVKPGAAANSLTASPLPLPGGYSQTINGSPDNFNPDDGLVSAVAVDPANDNLYILTDFTGSTSAFKEGLYAYALSGPNAGGITPVWTQTANAPSIAGNLNHIAIDPTTNEYYISVDNTQVVNGQYVYESSIVIGNLSSSSAPVTFQSLHGNSSGGPYPGGHAVDSDPTLGLVGTSAEAHRNGAPLTLLAEAPTITDTGGLLAGAAIAIASPETGDKLSIPGIVGGTLDGGEITVTGNNTSTLTLTGAASTAEYETLLGEATYQDDNGPPDNPRTFDWTVTDGLLTSAAQTTTVDTTPCYAHGARILTDKGEVAVETLAIGDRVVNKDGVARPIKWIGRRGYRGRFLIGAKHVLPIVFKAGCLGEGVPRRDLGVSPNHAMYLEGVLIPALALVDGDRVVQAPAADRVDYVHVELDSHDIIIAEGALSETFLDDDSRGLFHNAREYRALYPGEDKRLTRFCAPRVEHGAEVVAARRAIAKRAGRGEAREDVGALRGDFVVHAEGRVTGWAVNAAYPDAPVCLDILADGRLLGRALANKRGVDLVAAGPDGHGFTFRAPSGPATIEVRRSLDGAALRPAREWAA